MYSTRNTHLNLLNLIVLTKLVTDYKTHKANYAIFSVLTILPPFLVQIFYYAESSYNLHFLPFMWKTIFHIWTKQQVKLVFFLFMFLDWKWEGRHSQLSDSKYFNNFSSLKRQYWVVHFITRDISIFPHCLKIYELYFLLWVSCFWWQAVGTLCGLQKH